MNNKLFIHNKVFFILMVCIVFIAGNVTSLAFDQRLYIGFEKSIGKSHVFTSRDKAISFYESAGKRGEFIRVFQWLGGEYLKNYIVVSESYIRRGYKSIKVRSYDRDQMKIKKMYQEGWTVVGCTGAPYEGLTLIFAPNNIIRARRSRFNLIYPKNRGKLYKGHFKPYLYCRTGGGSKFYAFYTDYRTIKATAYIQASTKAKFDEITQMLRKKGFGFFKISGSGEWTATMINSKGGVLYPHKIKKYKSHRPLMSEAKRFVYQTPAFVGGGYESYTSTFEQKDESFYRIFE